MTSAQIKRTNRNRYQVASILYNLLMHADYFYQLLHHKVPCSFSQILSISFEWWILIIENVTNMTLFVTNFPRYHCSQKLSGCTIFLITCFIMVNIQIFDSLERCKIFFINWGKFVWLKCRISQNIREIHSLYHWPNFYVLESRLTFLN